MENPALFAADTPKRRLLALYERHGYARYRVGRFEEYDLYAKNRSFITGSAILTFTDTDGRLMALKPDVTLSVIKNTPVGGSLRKLYYAESVFRAPDPESGFAEIQQAGLECIGQLDPYSVAEIVSLAAESLGLLAETYILDVTHLGLLRGFFEDEGIPEEHWDKLLSLAEAKNTHDVREFSETRSLSEGAADTFRKLVHLRAPLAEGVRELSALPLGPYAADALSELANLAVALREVPGIWLDLSLKADTRYYNGVVLRGYLPGVPSAVLSGGRYDGLVHRMGKDAGAMGFAVYLNLLDRLTPRRQGPDADVLILDEGAESAALLRYVRDLTASGLRVRVDRAAPEGFRYTRLVRFQGGEARE